MCGWDDDGEDDHDADEVPGVPNKVSLTEARASFREFGASERRRIPAVRPPEEAEPPLMALL